MLTAAKLTLLDCEKEELTSVHSMSQGSSRSRRTKWHNYGETESWGQIHTNISLILWTLALFLMSQFRSRYFLASNICGKNICIISSQSSLCVSCYLQLSWRVILAWWVIQEGSNTLILRSYGIVCSEIVFLSSQAAGKTDSQNNFIQKKKKKKEYNIHVQHQKWSTWF